MRKLRYFTQITHIAECLPAVESGCGSEAYDIAHDKSRCAHIEVKGYEVSDRNIDDYIGDECHDSDALNLL